MTQTTTKKILSSTGKFGLKAMMHFVLVLFLFVNLNLISYACSFFFFKELPSLLYILCTTFILLIGIGFTVLACYKTYQYLMIDGVGVVYQHATPLVKKVCAFAINNISDISTNKLKIKGSHIEKVAGINNSIENVYDRQTPKAIKRILSFLINKIPFANLLDNIKDSIKSQDRDKTIEVLNQEVDKYVSGLVTSNNMKWLIWLTPLNIAIQGVCFMLSLFLR